MIAFRPVPLRTRMGVAPLPMPPAGMPGAPAPVLAPGAAGILEGILIVGITAAAAYLGITTGMGNGSSTQKTVGWASGIGSALLGLLYLGNRAGIWQTPPDLANKSIEDLMKVEITPAAK